MAGAGGGEGGGPFGRRSSPAKNWIGGFPGVGSTWTNPKGRGSKPGGIVSAPAPTPREGGGGHGETSTSTNTNLGQGGEDSGRPSMDSARRRVMQRTRRGLKGRAAAMLAHGKGTLPLAKRRLSGM